jgi:hypothetical protein
MCRFQQFGVSTMHPQRFNMLLALLLLALLSTRALCATGWFSPRIAGARSRPLKQTVSGHAFGKLKWL